MAQEDGLSETQQGKVTALEDGISESQQEEVDASGVDDCKWGWKEFLQRLEYIDKIIDQIVHSAILLNINFFAAFGFLQIQEIKPDNGFPVRDASILISVFGFSINMFLATSLARQEHIRKHYKDELKKTDIPLMPHDNKKPEKLLHKFGKLNPGYCVSWVYILVSVGLIFLGLAILSYYHIKGV